MRTVGRFLKQLVVGAIDDNITDVGAMMAFYAVLALFPMLVFVITIGMLVLDNETILQGVAMATQTMPFSTRELIASRVMAFVNSADGGFAIGGAALALWGASRGTAALGFYEKPEQRVPIQRIRVAADVPAAERTPLEILRTDTPTFQALVESRRNRREEWFIRPAGHIELCNVPLPVRPQAVATPPGG